MVVRNRGPMLVRADTHLTFAVVHSSHAGRRAIVHWSSDLATALCEGLGLLAAKAKSGMSRGRLDDRGGEPIDGLRDRGVQRRPPFAHGAGRRRGGGPRGQQGFPLQIS